MKKILTQETDRTVSKDENEKLVTIPIVRVEKENEHPSDIQREKDHPAYIQQEKEHPTVIRQEEEPPNDTLKEKDQLSENEKEKGFRVDKILDQWIHHI